MVIKEFGLKVKGLSSEERRRLRRLMGKLPDHNGGEENTRMAMLSVLKDAKKHQKSGSGHNGHKKQSDVMFIGSVSPSRHAPAQSALMGF